jgi:hypothetical protein
MRSPNIWMIGTGLAALFVLLASAQKGGGGAPQHRPLIVTHLFTGPDGQTHTEEIDAKFIMGKDNEVYKLIATSGAELHRAAPGTVIDWHTAPRRQYVITLSGQGEIEVAGGKKFHVGPGHIDLVEDTTGKGHITRVIGNEERVTLQLPLTDQTHR